MMTGRGFASRPQVAAAVSYAAGSAVGHFHCGNRPASAFAAMALVCAALAAAVSLPSVRAAVARLLRRANARRWRGPAILAALFLFAAARAAFSHGASIEAGRRLASYQSSDERISATGRIASVFRGEAAANGWWRHRFKLRDPVCRTRDGRFAVHGDVLVEWYATPPDKGGPVPASGRMIEVVGNVFARRAFDEATGPDVGDVRIVSGSTRSRYLGGHGAAAPLGRFRDSAASTLSRGLDSHPKERDLILAMTLGLRDALPRETMAVFRRAGTIHLFAISGLHVGALALMLAWLLSFLGVPRTFMALPLAPLLAAYVVMTGSQPSAIRAALMVCIHYSAILAGRRPYGLGTVSLALLAILAVQPEAIADISLVMSFTMVAGIMAFAGPVTSVCLHLARCRVLSAERDLAIFSETAGDPFARVYRWPRDFLIAAWAGAVSLFAASLTAALVSFPLTACIFGTLMPFSLLANIVAVPLAFPMMAVAGGGLLLSPILPGIEYATNSAAALLARIIAAVSEWTAALPLASTSAEFPVWALVAWYVAMFVLLRGVPGLIRPPLGAPGDDGAHASFYS